MDALGPIRPPDPRASRPSPRAATPADPAPVAPVGRRSDVAGVGGAGSPPAGDSRFPGFDDADVARILARAAELDALAPGSGVLPTLAAHRLLSLSDLESVAIEAGIDPHHVRTAASELALQRPSSAPAAVPMKAPMGLAERVDTERVLPVAVDEDTWGRMVQELRDHTGAPGVVTTLGGVREWHSKSDGGAETVTLRAEPLGVGGTRLSVSRNTSASGVMALTFGATFAFIALMFVVLFLLVPPTDGLARLPAVLGGVAGLGALVTGGTVVAGHRHLKRTGDRQDALLDRLELLALKGGAG